jgi:magnesium chelatase family protein
MVGPPGSGKSMLAQRFAGLLPPMTVDEALQSAAMASLAGRFSPARWASGPPAARTTRPVRWRWWAVAHRRARARSRWRTTACCSWMSCPEFPRAALEALREPLETGHITIARGAALRVPGALSAHRRDEPLPLRLPGRPAQGLPLHARPGGALPGQAQRPAAGPHRPACGGAGAARRELVQAPPGESTHHPRALPAGPATGLAAPG